MDFPHEQIEARPVRSPHPLGSLVSWMTVHGWVGRLYAAVVLAGAVGVLLAAAWIHPAGKHMGTHQQLGLPACGFEISTGIPCPTCGMTTAFAHTVHGHWIEAVRSQLAGFAFALLTIAVAIGAALGVIIGRVPLPNWYRINPTTVVWWCSALFVLAWAIKVAQVLMRTGQ